MSSSSQAPAQIYLMSKNPAVGGGKLGKSTRGWSSLPNAITHKILDHVISSADTTWPLEEAWKNMPESKETSEAIARRVELCELRSVSRGWRNGIDSHPFWLKYTLTLDPSKSHGSTVADLRSSRITPSTPTFSSLFHRARNLTLEICLPCRLNYPDRMGFYPSERKLVTWSNNLGAVPTCARHRNRYCTSCLREDGMTPNNQSGYCVRLQSCRGDVDYQGEYYQYPVICNDCREKSLTTHIEIELERCARGLKPTAAYDILQTHYAQDYISMPSYNAREAAKLAVREAWLSHHTEWLSLLPVIKALQIEENSIRLTFLAFGRRDTKDALDKRRSLLEALFDEPASNIREYSARVFQDMSERYSDWKEDGDENEVDDLFVEGFADVREFWIELAQDAAIYRWARDRIRAGYWILPSDELDAILQPELETISPRDIILSTAQLPNGVLLGPDRTFNLESLKFELFDPDDESSFLPPRSLLESLDEMYRQLLFKTIQRPFYHRIMEHISSGFDDDELEERRLDLDGFLDYLGQEDAWMDLLPRRSPISFRISTQDWDVRRQATNVGSPKIQAIRSDLGTEEHGPHGNGFIMEVEQESGPFLTLDDVAQTDNEDEEYDGRGRSEEDSGVSSEESMQDNGVKSSDDSLGNGTTTPPVLAGLGSPYATPSNKIVGHDYQRTVEQPVNEINENGKRKTPPTMTTSHNDEPERVKNDEDISRPTKRRSSSSSHSQSLSNPSSDIHFNGTEGNEPNPDLPLKSSVSGESLTSSDPMPSTPNDLLTSLQPAESIKNDLELLEIKRRERAKAEPRIAAGYVPHIPAVGMKLGVETERFMGRVYDGVLAPHIMCRCGICMRGLSQRGR